MMFLIIMAGSACAQLSVRLKAPRTNYLKGEQVVVTVTLTNNAGEDLSFGGDPGRSWLEIFMTDRSGKNVVPTTRGRFAPGRIGAGQTLSRQITVSNLFPMQKLGNYNFYANVRLSGQDRGGFASNRIYVNVSEGRTVSSARVGSPKRPIEHRVITFNGDKGTLLFAQVIDVNKGYPLNTKNLGSVVLYQRPRSMIDGSQNNHILYLVSPKLYNYVVMDTRGAAIKVAQFKRASTDPRLEKFGNGEVTVAGGIPHDPEAERQKRLTIHKLSDRPAGTFR